MDQGKKTPGLRGVDLKIVTRIFRKKMLTGEKFQILQNFRVKNFKFCKILELVQIWTKYPRGVKLKTISN